jgi:DNA-directed RNA polymerase specialized sigma24 family protein
MDRLIKCQRRKKRMILNDSISINKNVNNNPDLSIEDLIASKYNLEEEYECFDRYKRILDKKYDLELIDSSILELKVNGFSIREIAKLLELTYKTVDYRMRKIRKKICKITY